MIKGFHSLNSIRFSVICKGSDKVSESFDECALSKKRFTETSCFLSIFSRDKKNFTITSTFFLFLSSWI